MLHTTEAQNFEKEIQMEQDSHSVLETMALLIRQFDSVLLNIRNGGGKNQIISVITQRAVSTRIAGRPKIKLNGAIKFLYMTTQLLQDIHFYKPEENIKLC